MPAYTKQLLIQAYIFGLIGCFFATCAWFNHKQQGVIYFHDNIPSICNTSHGLKQKKIIPVYSEKQLRDHYGLTFEIRFRDHKSPRLYGALYYQDPKKNLYCMALPNGRFASFSDSKIGNGRNLIQELCYPIKECDGY